MNKKNLIKTIIVVFVLISLTVMPAYAWKVKTHVYSANLILEDAADGFVELAPYGEFEILPEYQTILRMYPDYFRAGALGPDLMPDIIIGQTIFHPGNTYSTSGDIIQRFWHRVNELPDYAPSALEQQMNNSMHTTLPIDHVPSRDDFDPGDDCLEMNNKKQAQAFMLGFMSHAAGDYFGHSYVNKWAQGSWPELTDADGISEADKKIIKRHSALEAHIDSKIPAKYQTASYNTIASPQDFIFDSMIVNGETDLRSFIRDHRSSETFGDSTTAPHIELFFAIRDACKERLIDINNSSAIEKLARAPEKAYCEAWIEDIDRGLGAWVKANEEAARTMLYKDSTMTQYVDVLKEWSDDHLMLMLGYPDVTNDIKNKIGNINDFIMRVVPAAWQQEYKDLKMNAINYIVKESVGIDINGWIEVFNPPISVLQTNLFENGAYATINRDMANFNTCINTEDQEFVPFKNTLTLMKLILIGEPGIQELRRVSGSDSTLSFPPFTNTMTYFIRNMDIGYDWEVGSPMMGFFMWGSNDDRYKILNNIFVMDPDEVKPTFSDMTQGPIEIIPGSRSWDDPVPDIYIKYYNTDQIGNDIGLYSTSTFTNYGNPEQHKTIAANENGDFTVTTPAKGGKYHFRFYDKNQYLLAVSDEIEVVEVTQYSSQPLGNTQAQSVGNTQEQSVESTNTQPNQTTNSNTNTTSDNNVPIGTADLSTGRIKHTWKAPGSINAAVTSEEDYSTSVFFSVDPELLEFINMDEDEQNELGISSISHTAQIDWKLNDGPWHYTSDWDTLSEQYSYHSGIYADTGYLYGETKDEKMIFDLRNDSDGLTELQKKLGGAIIYGNDDYGEENRLNLANNTFYFRVRLFVSYFDESNYEDGFILTPWSETIAYGKESLSSQTNAQPSQPPAAQTGTSSNEHSETFDEGTLLSWQNCSALGYRLFRSESEDELGISVTDFYITSTSYADVNVEPNTTYYYSVRPVLNEADPLNGQDEILGDVIKRYTVTTVDNIINQEKQKDFIILQIDNPNISVNGVLKEIDPGRGTTPMIISSRSMVPIRAVVEAINGTVSWDNSTQQITLTANGNTVIMWIDKYEIIVNGTKYKIDVAPTIVNGRTYVPVRFAAENLSTKIYWINTTKQAVIVN